MGGVILTKDSRAAVPALVSTKLKIESPPRGDFELP